MALKQLIKTQMKWRKKTQKCVEIATATKIRENVIEKKKPAKLTLAYARALLSIEEISSS